MYPPISPQSILRNGAHLFSAALFASVISFIQGIIVARELGSTNYGLVALLIGICGITVSFLSFRTSEALATHLIKQQNEVHRQKLLLQSGIFADAITRTGAAILLTLLSSFLMNKFNIPSDYSASFLLLVLALPFDCFDAAWTALARVQDRILLLGWFPGFFTVLQACIVLSLSMVGKLTLQSYIFVLFATTMVKALSQAVMVFGPLGTALSISLGSMLSPTILFRWREVHGFWKQMTSGYLSSLISAVVKNGDTLFLGYLRNPHDLGCYKLARSLAGILSMIGNHASFGIFKELNQLVAQRRIKELHTMLLRLSVIWVPSVALCTVILIAVGSPLIALVYGQEYRDASAPFSILVSGIAVSLALFWAQPLVIATQQLRAYLYSTVIVGVWFVCANYLLIPIWGSSGSAVALGGSWVIGYLLCLRIGIRWMRHSLTQGSNSL